MLFRSSVVLGAAALGIFISLTAPVKAAVCGRVTIAAMNWSSATFIAHVDRFILEHGYGCDAQLVVGDTMPTGTSMIEKGEPDIAPELWTNGIREALDRIENGTYGLCEECGEEISEKRLTARPVTTLCIECKSSQEQQESRLKKPDIPPGTEDIH